MKRLLPFVVLFLGILLLAGAGFYLWHAAQAPAPVAVGKDVPDSLGGLSLTQTLSGRAATANIEQLHGTDFPLISGFVAEYGQKNATLWVAVTSSETQAAELVKKMEASIAKGTSPFKPRGVFQIKNRDIYMLDGMNQSNFYFQSGAKVIWLSVNEAQAEQGMGDALAFYP